MKGILSGKARKSKSGDNTLCYLVQSIVFKNNEW